MKTALCVILGLLYTANFACGAETWSAIYPGSESDRIASIQETSDGGCIVAGYTNNWGSNNYFWLLKFDENGVVSWRRTYGDGGNFTDSGLLMQQTPGGGYVVACTRSFGPGNEDIQMLKLRENGDIQWQKRLGGSGNDRAFFIRQTRDGGYITGGWTNITLNGVNYDSLLIKLNSSGDVEWRNTYGGAYSDQATSILQTDDSGYIMAGWTYSFGGDDREIWLLKLRPDGELQWQRIYESNNHDSNYTIQQGNDGVYIVESCNLFQDRYEVLALQLKQNGDIDRRKTYSGKYRVGCDQLYAAYQTKDEGFVFAGGTKAASDRDRDAVIMKRQQDGDISWIRSYGGKGDDYAEAVQQTLDGSYLAAGWTYSFGSGGRSIWVLKLDNQGRIPEDKILQTRNTAAEDFEICAVTAVHLAHGPRKLTIAIDWQQNLNLYVSGPNGYRYSFPSKEISTLRQALVQAFALTGRQKRSSGSSGIQEIAQIKNGPQTLTIVVRSDKQGMGEAGLFLLEMTNYTASKENPLIVASDQVQKIIDALAPENLEKAFSQMLKIKPSIIQSPSAESKG
jgi:hypothetical protein